MENILRGFEEDTETFLCRLRERFDRVGVDIPKVEVRYKHLSVEGDAYLGTRALPTLPNSVLNVIEGLLEKVQLSPSKKKTIKILDDVSGIIKPSRMTLLIGPPGSGKTTLMKGLSGMLDKELRVTGTVTYCGHEMSEFIPQKTCAYISQNDLHHGEMTVRETLDFARLCLGGGTKYEILEELTRREVAAGIQPDPDIDAFMKATAIADQESTLVTDYILKVLDLKACANLLVGDEMRRGISGGEKKRLTIGEMLVGPAKAFFIDEASTGLDSSTTYQIVKHMRQMVHVMDMTMTISLLQPAPETFELFDDIILLSEGRIVYQGPREHVLEFFESVGFTCPERKDVADFVQEIISMKDQEQYWNRNNEPYQYITAADFADLFSSFYIGQKLSDNLSVPFDKSTTHPAALVTDKCGISKVDIFKVCLSREWLLMKHSSVLYIFKTTQITIMAIFTLTVFFRTEMKSGQLMDANKFYSALFFSLLSLMFNGLSEIALTVIRLPIFFKQRDSLFYPAWAFALPIWFLRVPVSLMESLIWILLTYYSIGFAPSASRFFCQLLAFFALHQMALSLFRLVSAIGRTQIVANTLGTLVLLMVFLYGGFIISKDDIAPWMRWCYYISPTMYGQNALAINEFLDNRWDIPNNDSRFAQPTVGKVLLASRGMFLDKQMYWICVAALFGFSFMFNICFIIALTYLDPYGDSKSVTVEKDDNTKIGKQALSDTEVFSQTSAFTVPIFEGIDMAVGRTSETIISIEVTETRKRRIMLPFQPLSLTFTHVNYYVDMPFEMKKQGIKEHRMQLLSDVSGSFRPGVLTALVGVSGAGKTTLMDVLAGRKTGGYIEGSINISGYPKNQSTFARISGYCEQNDIHSPHVTVYESLVYSAWLRLSPDIKKQKRKMFIDEVMELVELNPIKDVLVGLPGVDGLSTEQRKRLTIAVELVANPSIIFMDEPTTSLDARAAAIVMRTVRNTVDTGRTVVCTIHQPSIDIFEAFDELLLMKRGGEVIYGGPLGQQSCLLLEYFGSIPGVPTMKEGTNPATWMLKISTPAVEAQLGVNYAKIYANSNLYRSNQDLIRQLNLPPPGSKDLYFPTIYAQPFIIQCKACFWKQRSSYWRHPEYNTIRIFLTIIISIICGAVFWDRGDKISKQQDLNDILGAMYAVAMFLGGANTYAVLPVVDIERTVFYREKKAGMYSSMPYAFGQLAIEIIYVAFQTFICSLLLYSMIGFHWDAAKFFWFYYYVFLSFLYLTFYGMMLVALTPTYQIAAVTITFFLSFWNLFSGFVIFRMDIPVWWRWYYWGSPVAWTLNGLVTSQIGDRTDPIQVPGLGDIPLRTYLERFLGFHHDFLGYVAVAHIGWAILFSFVFAYGIKFLNFQKR